MKPIEITTKQKKKLLEMCRALFPELQSKCEKEGLKWCKKAGGTLEEWETGFRFSGHKSPLIYCSYPYDYDFHEHLLPNDKDPGIHWFEFCLVNLVEKLFTDEVFNFSCSKNTKQIEIHLVDYLYDYYKEKSKKLKH